MSAATAHAKRGNAGESEPSTRSLRGLDGINFLMADVRDGVGPYLSVFLKAGEHWDSGAIGIAMAASSIAAAVCQVPAGLLVDGTRAKRLLIAASGLMVGVGCLLIVLFPHFLTVVAAQALLGSASAVIPPAIAALSLGLVGRRLLDARISRNESFNHGGNFVAAGMAGVLGQYIGYHWIFYLVCAFAIASAGIVTFINPAEIDHERARWRGPEQQVRANPVPRPPQAAGSADLPRLGRAVPLRQRGYVAYGRAGAGAQAPGIGHHRSVSVHHRRPVCDGGRGLGGWPGIRTGHRSQDNLPRGSRRAAGARCAVLLHHQSHRSRCNPAARRRGGRHLRGNRRSDRRRSDAWDWTVQSRPGADRAGSGHRRRAEQRHLRPRCPMVRLRYRFSVPRVHRPLRARFLCLAHAGNQGGQRRSRLALQPCRPAVA